jgi:hypothetical protein
MSPTLNAMVNLLTRLVRSDFMVGEEFSRIDGDDTRLIRVDPWGSSPFDQSQKRAKRYRSEIPLFLDLEIEQQPRLALYDRYQL